MEPLCTWIIWSIACLIHVAEIPENNKSIMGSKSFEQPTHKHARIEKSTTKHLIDTSIKKTTNKNNKNVIYTSNCYIHTSKTESIQQEIICNDSIWETAQVAVNNMRTGWNLGNTLDAKPIAPLPDSNTPSHYETSWGQPVTKPELFQMMAEAGFGAVRVPVTWDMHIDPITYKVDKAWMDRVEEVVQYILNAGMYCILNVHHDTGEDGWLVADMEIYKNVKTKYRKLWEQISERFRQYNHKLLFEGFNEMLDSKKSWSSPTVMGAYQAINLYNQDFVDIVRASGGNNVSRNLVVNTYSAHPGNFQFFKLPKDIHDNHLIVEVHSYSPYNFAFAKTGDNDKTIFDKKGELEIKNIIKELNTEFVRKGIPCIIGEYGAVDKNNESERAKQAACYVKEAKEVNICCFYWMGISNGVDRSIPQWTEPKIKDAIINTYNQ